MWEPRLFDFSTNLNDYFETVQIDGHNVKMPKFGRGVFTQIVKGEVKKTIDGEFTLAMEILDIDPIAKKVAPDLCVLALDRPTENFSFPSTNPYNRSSFQIFIIKNVIFKDDGIVEILADHVKYMFFNNVLIGDAAGTPEIVEGDAQTVINNLLSDPAELFLTNYFSVVVPAGSEISIDIGSNTNRTLGELFTNSEDGICKQLNTWMDFDNFKIELMTYSTNAVDTLRFGSNISSFEKEWTNEEEYTHIVPYATVDTLDSYSGSIKNVTLYGTNSPLSTGSTSEFSRVLLVDFSNKFNKKGGYVDPNSPYGQGYTEVRDRLETLGQNYISKHSEIKTSSMNFVVDDVSTIDKLNVYIGSAVKVIYEPLNYYKKHRITGYTYDIPTNKYSQITVGDRKFTLYDFIKKQNK